MTIFSMDRELNWIMITPDINNSLIVSWYLKKIIEKCEHILSTPNVMIIDKPKVQAAACPKKNLDKNKSLNYSSCHTWLSCEWIICFNSVIFSGGKAILLV